MKTINVTVWWDYKHCEDFVIPEYMLNDISKAFENKEVFKFEYAECMYHLNFTNARWLRWNIKNEASS